MRVQFVPRHMPLELYAAFYTPKYPYVASPISAHVTLNPNIGIHVSGCVGLTCDPWEMHSPSWFRVSGLRFRVQGLLALSLSLSLSVDLSICLSISLFIYLHIYMYAYIYIDAYMPNIFRIHTHVILQACPIVVYCST